MAFTIKKLIKVMAALILIFQGIYAVAAPCDIKNSPPPFIQHNLTPTISWCELCGYGYVTIVVNNPYVGADMINMSVMEDLRTSGLTFEPTAPTPMRVNGASLGAGSYPNVSGTNGSVLTWPTAKFAQLSSLAWVPGINNFKTLTITVAVKRNSALTQEGLITASRQIRASLSYSTNPVCAVSSPVSTGLDTLPFREPLPVITKGGRNVDAGQTSYTNPMFGTNRDDVIWRIQVTNNGLAAMQDMRFDDVMQPGSMVTNYACPTETAALAIANNNGVAPGGTTCVAATNTINNFIVNGLFSIPDNSIFDAPAQGSNFFYLVGKVINNGACISNKTNTVSDVQWGCEVDPPAGGITATSTGTTPGGSATLRTLVTPAGLTVTANLTGTNVTQPVGSKGLMTITIINNSNGAVKNIKLSDVLPLEYVVDSTFTPTFQIIHPGGYGNYAGMVNAVVWTNPVAGTFPLTTTNPALPLANTQPAFSLVSSAPHPVAVVNPDNATQFNMLRHGDRVVVTFRVVLIKTSSYDKVANLDVQQESPLGSPCCTDPSNQTTTLTNTLTATYEDFCNLGTTKNVVGSPFNQNFNAFPEDLDIDIGGTVFILTNDPLQPVTLPVIVKNNGGHDARDYNVFVTFGGTMQVLSAPSGCSPYAISGTPPQPAPWKVWTLPAAIPDPSKYPTVYRCVPGGALPNPMGPGSTTTLNFQVIKVRPTDPNYAARITADDLSFRADVVGEIMLSNVPPSPSGQALWFPTPTVRADGQTDRANNYSLDAIRARVIGFNLAKSLLGNCSENPLVVDTLVQIGEECTFHIDTGGWFGFQTPGFTYIAVQNITVTDQVPSGQGYISNNVPLPTQPSTSQINNVTITPQTNPPLNTLDIDWIDWKFNPVGNTANRITQKDEWFRANITNRLLNSPINVSAPPNQHSLLSTDVLNSTFEAVFNNASTGLEEVFLLGPGTVGYPQAFARTVNLTVTEPKLTLVKEVCNETKSLTGIGANCTPFATFLNNGDTFDSYVYRITVTNNQAGSPVQAAPAFDVVVTDTLDTKHLYLVKDFTTDLLDNDGDGTPDPGDMSEGTIANNTLGNPLPAIITFSYMHSPALQKIVTGVPVRLYYRVDPDQSLQAGDTLINSVTATYDTLSGTYGAQSIPSVSGTLGGARTYTTSPVTATLQMANPQTLPIEIIARSNHSVPATPPSTYPVSVGEEIKYRLHTLLPIAQLNNFKIVDQLPAGLICSQIPALDLSASGPYGSIGFVTSKPSTTITPTCSVSNLITWDFGNLNLTNGAGTSLYDFQIDFIARVENSTTTNNALILSNGGASAYAQYTNSSGTLVTLAYGRVDAVVQEPVVTLTKVFSQATADAGDQLTVTITATNTGTADAYNLRVIDDLTATKITYVGSVGGTGPPDSIDNTTVPNRPLFIWNTLPAGQSRQFIFSVSVNSGTTGVQPNEIISNTIQATWTSLPGQTTRLNTNGTPPYVIGIDGAPDGLRDGSASPTYNDYHTTANASFVVQPVSMVKLDQTTSTVPAIGALKQFQVAITFPEGTTKSVVLTDALNTGGNSYHLVNSTPYEISYTFEGISTINGVVPVNGTAPVAITSPLDGTINTATWNIGDVVTTSKDDTVSAAIPRRILITYYARIYNDAATNAGGSLRNSVTLNYTNGTAITSSPPAVTVVEPLITLTKNVVNLGATWQYTLVMTAANGTLNSAAFDVAITETLDAGLTYVPSSASFTTSGGASVSGINPTVSGQVLSWNLALGNDIDIPKNTPTAATVTLVYQVSYPAIQTSNLSSYSLVQWTSLNGVNTFERDGSAAPGYGGASWNDYFTTIVVTTPQYADNTQFTKTRLSDTYGALDANVRIGDVVDYKLTVHFSQGTTLNARVVDVLPQGLEFLSVVSVNGDFTPPIYSQAAPFTYADISPPTVSGTPATGPTTVTWTLGNITNADASNTTASDFVIVYRAKVLNGTALSHVATQSLTNNATFYYTNVTATGLPSLPVTITVQQPILGITKIATPPVGRTNTTLLPGDVVQYTVDVTNTGNAPAYDVVLKDLIPVGMRNGATTVTIISATINGSSILPLASGVFVYDLPSNTATWNFDLGAQNQYMIPAGGTLQIVYRVNTNLGLSAGWSMVNAAQIQDYCSFDSQDIPANGFVAWRKCYGLSVAVTAPVNITAPVSLSKQNWPTSEVTAVVGQQFTYRITVPATPQTTSLYDVQIFDNLAAIPGVDLSYVSIAAVSGTGLVTWTPVVTWAPQNLVISGSGVGGLDIPAGQQAVFDLTVMLNNTVNNTSGKTFQNSASYTYDQDNNVVNPQPTTPAVSPIRTIVGPDTVIMQKGGPTTMNVGVPGTFTLDVQNTGTGTAWDMTIQDRLPNLVQGGMCDTAPTIVSVLNDGVALMSGTDYTTSFTPAPVPPSFCTLTIEMKTSAAAILPTKHLIVTYQASLNATTLGGLPLTNVAGATQWFAADTPANVATGQLHTYTGVLTNGTVGTPDNQDAHTLTTASPLLQFLKSVNKVTSTGALISGATAIPGDLLRYTLVINNQSSLPVINFTLTDELDRLNATAMYLPGSLTLISIPVGASATLTNSTGGSKGTGLVDIRNLDIAANGTLTIIFEVKLASVITNGTAVLNQAQLPVTVTPIDSDDPAINGSHDPSLAIPGPIDPTRTVITSAPVFRVQKTSQDITGDPMVLLAGERLRYTITVKNIGNESASNVILRDALPANTSYVAGSTQLNGVVVADVGIASALQTGMLINAPENLTAGVMRADASATVSNVATITFVVQINSNVLNGTIISNQGFVTGSGLGSGLFPEKPSDDPGTPAVDDPTLNVVGNFPLLIAQKIVAIQTDVNGDGIVDPLDVLRYTITISNLASIPATGVIFTDLVPANTTYVANTVTLNSLPIGVPDGGVSPLITGIGVESPVSSPGTINAKSSAVITFDVQVNAGVVAGTVISNQGNVTSVELPNEPTDADGNPSNGHQPTTIIVGYAQQLSITKQVTVVGGGPALAGGQLEYLVRVTNPGTVSATNVIITDNLGLPPLSTQVTYVAGSATLNGSTTGVTVTGALITTTSTPVAPGATLQLRFRVTINAGLAMGTTITNTGMVAWNTPTLTASASVSIDVGGVPGSANLNGHVWYDANHNTAAEPTELNLAGWLVEVYRNNILLGSTLTDANGLYTVAGLTPTTTTNFEEEYAIRFSAPGAVVTTAKLGLAVSPYTNGLQQIGAIIALSGSSLQNLNLPITPDGVVYNSILRSPASGVILNMVRINTTSNPPSTIVLPKTCFDDPEQQGQVTIASGYYKFDINFTDPSCQQGSEYLIVPSSPAAYMPGQSLIIPPLSDFSTLSFSVPNCPSPATLVTVALPPPSTSNLTYCESQLSEFQPGLAVPAKTLGTNYFLRMLLRDTPIPQNSQLFNNHIAVDPRLDNAVSITKIAALQNVTKGQLIPYTITVSNTLPVTLTSMNIVDTFPPGFKYVAGSGRIDGLPVEPVSTTRDLTWGNLQLVTNTKRVIQLMLIVGSGVKEGKYVNRARVINAITNGFGSPEASATVRVIPDPTLDCSDVIGKVFDDANLNGYQDEGEKGLVGVRVVTARGLIVTTDKYGRFHLTCAVVPDPDRGSNFILKIDDRSLPSGYRITTENPRVLRATRGKMLKFNFGAAIHKVVKLDVADGVFEPGTSEMRVQWKQRVELLLTELKKAPSVLRLSYLAETETEGLVDTRLDLLKSEITNLWKKKKGKYDLTIETEVFWRTGSPPEKSEVSN